MADSSSVTDRSTTVTFTFKLAVRCGGLISDS
jgi:hypothetical protein